VPHLHDREANSAIEAAIRSRTSSFSSGDVPAEERTNLRPQGFRDLRDGLRIVLPVFSSRSKTTQFRMRSRRFAGVSIPSPAGSVFTKLAFELLDGLRVWRLPLEVEPVRGERRPVDRGLPAARDEDLDGLEELPQPEFAEPVLRRLVPREFVERVKLPFLAERGALCTRR
jgi:hypothetical protein